jgi:hypothetical protein
LRAFPLPVFDAQTTPILAAPHSSETLFGTILTAAFANAIQATKLDSTPIRGDGKVTFSADFFAFSFAVPYLAQPHHLAEIPFPRILQFREQAKAICSVYCSEIIFEQAIRVRKTPWRQAMDATSFAQPHPFRR